MGNKIAVLRKMCCEFIRNFRNLFGILSDFSGLQEKSGKHSEQIQDMFFSVWKYLDNG